MVEYAKDVLVTTEWLAEHLDDPSLVVAEVDEDPDLYDDGHIPGAVKLHWRDDLQDPVERDLVDKETFERLMGRLGVSGASTVVLYGDKNNWFAAYAYWYLKIYGHEDVRILDGGRQKWLDEGRELTTEVPSSERVEYRASERDETLRAYRDALREASAPPRRRSSTSAARRSSRATSSRRPATNRKARSGPGTSRPPSRSRGRRRCVTTARSGRGKSCRRSTSRRASPPARR